MVDSAVEGEMAGKSGCCFCFTVPVGVAKWYLYFAAVFPSPPLQQKIQFASKFYSPHIPHPKLLENPIPSSFRGLWIGGPGYHGRVRSHLASLPQSPCPVRGPGEAARAAPAAAKGATCRVAERMACGVADGGGTGVVRVARWGVGMGWGRWGWSFLKFVGCFRVFGGLERMSSDMFEGQICMTRQKKGLVCRKLNLGADQNVSSFQDSKLNNDQLGKATDSVI